MKDTFLALRTAYISRLRGNVIVEGEEIPVYGKIVPPDVGPRYIYIPSQSSINNSGKGCWGTDSSLNVEIVVKSFDGGSSYIVDEIADQVKELITSHDPVDWPQIDPEFWLTDCQFESDTELIDWVNNAWIMRRIITFNNLISEEEI